MPRPSPVGAWLPELNKRSEALFGRRLRVVHPRRPSGSSLQLPEHGSQSRYKRDNRHYIAHQCDLPRGVATMFESFIDVAHRDHHLFITTPT
jgi:hypothetical protein